MRLRIQILFKLFWDSMFEWMQNRCRHWKLQMHSRWDYHILKWKTFYIKDICDIQNGIKQNQLGIRWKDALCTNMENVLLIM